MKATIKLEGVPPETIKALRESQALKDLGVKFKVVKVTRQKRTKKENERK